MRRKKKVAESGKSQTEQVAEARKEQTKAARRKLFATPEFIVASGILAFWTLALVPFGDPLFTMIAWFVVFGIGEWLLYMAVRDGSHGFLTFAAGYTLSLGVSAVVARDWLMPISLVIAGLSALLVTDLVRINFGRRRGAELPSALISSTLLATGLVGFASLLSFSLVTALADESADRSWMWVPAISGALVVLTAVVTFMLSRSSARSEIRGWKPGETMLPPPTQD